MMLKTLLKLQFRQLLASFTRKSSKKRGTEKRSTGMIVLLVLLFGYCAVVFIGLFALLFWGLGTFLGGGESGWAYFASLAFLTFLIDFIFTIFTAKSQLFEAKDNETLLSLPIRPRDILLSRMLMLLITDYLFEAIIALPAIVVWCLLGYATPLGVICFLVGVVAMPLLALTFSCFVGWLLSLLTARMKNPAVFTTLLGVGLFLLYFYGYSKLMNGMEMTPEMALKIADSLEGVLFYPFYCFGRAAADGSLLHLFYYLLFMGVPFALLVWILSKTFLSLATKKAGGTKTVYRATVVKASSQTKALLNNEFRRIGSSAAYMLNAGMGLLFLVIIAIGVFFLPVELFAEMGLSVGIVPMLVTSAISFMTGMTLFSASSISLEGQNIYALQSLPIAGRTVLRVKLYAHLILTSPLTLIASVASLVALILSPACHVTVGAAVGLILVPQAYNLFVALTGLILNLALPRFDWTDESTVVKQSGAVGLTMLICMVGSMTVLILGNVLSALFSPALGMTIAAIPPLGVSLGFWLYLDKKGDAAFEKLG